MAIASQSRRQGEALPSSGAAALDRHRAAILFFLYQCRGPRGFSTDVMDIVDGASGSSTEIQRRIDCMEASVWSLLWGQAGWDASARVEHPLFVVSECALYFYWLRFWVEKIAARRPPPVGAAHPQVESLQNALDAALDDRETNGHVETRAVRHMTEYHAPLDVRSTHFRRSVRQADVDIGEAVRGTCVNDQDADDFVRRVKLNPGTDKATRALVADDEMCVWRMALWCYVFSQTCPKPAGVPAAEGVFSAWYYVPRGDIGSERFYRIVGFRDARGGALQRPVICHLGAGSWCVFESPDVVFVCATAAHAICTWLHIVHSKFDGVIENSTPVPEKPSEFMS